MMKSKWSVVRYISNNRDGMRLRMLQKLRGIDTIRETGGEYKS